MQENPTQVIHKQSGPVLVLRAASLQVTSGPDQGHGCAMSLKRVRVGSAADNDLVLSDPLVSRHHLEFRVQDSGYLVVDLQSTNGTHYRGARVREVEVGIGTEVRLGSTVLRIEQGTVSSVEVAGQSGFGLLIGTSEPMQQVYGLLAAVAPSDATVLIEGETGTGKELVAQQIHQQSPRAERMFAVVDCGSLPGGLIESELFGHERGAFTGADKERAGIFEHCSGGTVFLDEIGELPLELQTRLLRVLDQRTVQRVGGNVRRRVDVRLVAATNRALAQEAKAGRFRQDLYYRLAVVRIVLPPLRRRREDIPQLARHFLCQGGCADPDAVLTPEVLEALDSRRWTGNIRELRNALERAVLLSDGAEGLLIDEAPTRLTELSAPHPSPSAPPAVPATGSAAGSTPGAPAPPAAGAPLSAGIGVARMLSPAFFKLPFKELKQLLLEELEDVYIGRLLEKHGKNISRIAGEAQVDRHLVRKVMNRLENT